MLTVALVKSCSHSAREAADLRQTRGCVASVNDALLRPGSHRRPKHRGCPMTTSFASPGSMNVDWEERWNVERLRTYRLARARAALAASDLGAVLLFDFNNIRYVTSTHIGEWARDKMTRYALLTRGGDPHIWDFGSAAKHHRLNCPWLRPENVHAGMIGLRGAVAPDAGLFRAAAREIAAILKAEGVADMPIGVDIVEPPMLAALTDEGITVRDGQQVMLDAREVKSIDEIILLNTACAMVDGAYQLISEQLKPGIRESELVANVTKFLFDLGLGARRQHQRRVGRALQPAPARLLRPDHPARRPGVLRHHPDVRRLQDLLLPDVRGRQGERRPARRLQAGARVDRRVHRAHATRRDDRPGRQGLAEGPGVRLRQRDGVLRPPVRPQRRACSSTSGRSSAGSTRSSTRSSSRRGWSSRSRPTARRRTASPPRGSRRRSSSPPTARRSSPASRPTSCSSPTPY